MPLSATEKIIQNYLIVDQKMRRKTATRMIKIMNSKQKEEMLLLIKEYAYECLTLNPKIKI